MGKVEKPWLPTPTPKLEEDEDEDALGREPLLLRLLPAGFFLHALYSVLACILLVLEAEAPVSVLGRELSSFLELVLVVPVLVLVGAGSGYLAWAIDARRPEARLASVVLPSLLAMGALILGPLLGLPVLDVFLDMAWKPLGVALGMGVLFYGGGSVGTYFDRAVADRLRLEAGRRSAMALEAGGREEE